MTCDGPNCMCSACFRRMCPISAENHRDEPGTRANIAQSLTRRCSNCYHLLPGYQVAAWYWITPNVGPFCEDCAKQIKEAK